MRFDLAPGDLIALVAMLADGLLECGVPCFSCVRFFRSEHGKAVYKETSRRMVRLGGFPAGS
jgi:hypothetical protein